MARQLLFSNWQKLLFERLTTSNDETIAAVAAKAVKEVAYHEEMAAEWVIRLGDGTAESRQRMVDGLGWNWRFVPELFEMDEVARAIAERGIGAAVTACRDDYDHKDRAVLDEAGLAAPHDQGPSLGRRDRPHHGYHGSFLAQA